MQVQGKLLALAAVALFAVSAASSATAQGRGGGGGGGMGSRGGGMPPSGGMGEGGMGSRPASTPPLGRGSIGSQPAGGPPPGGSPRDQSTNSTMRGGLQLGPPGRWWDDKSFAKSLKLRGDQQTRMDAIFEQNRSALLARYQNLQQAESQMEEITRGPSPDEAALFSGIDHVAQARAELEKATAHYLLLIRKEMDADQIDRLEKHR